MALATSPWLTMWIAPRVTVRRLIAEESAPSWIPVVLLAGVHQALLWSLGNSRSVATSDPTTVVGLAIFVGVVQLVYSVLIGPFLLAIVGGWFGGEGDPAEIRQAIAWGLVPVAVTAVIWIPLLEAYGRAAFDPNRGMPHTPLQWVTVPLFLVIPVASVWSLVLQIIGVAEAQRFSILRAFISIVILAVPFWLVTGLLR